MTQRDLFNEGEFDAYLDTLVTVCLAAASPLAGHEQGPRYLEAPDASPASPHDGGDESEDGMHLEPVTLAYTAEERYERECYEGDDAYAREVGIPRFGEI